LSSCIPLLLLNILSCCIFAVDRLDFTSRLGIIVTILLALFAFLPTYRQQIPIPTITALDVALFASVFIMLLTAVDSLVGSVDTNNTSSLGHYILLGISVAIVLGMTVYTLVKYGRYLKGKKKNWKSLEPRKRLELRKRLVLM